MSGLVDIHSICAMLAERAPALAATLLPNGRQEGREWCVGSLAGEPGRSLKVHLEGARAGVWSDFGNSGPGSKGDALDLVAWVLFGGDKKRAVAWSRRWLGIDHADPGAIAQSRRQAAVRKESADREEKAKRGAALRLFLSAQARIAGTAAEIYLRGRGIDFARLGRQPSCLRFHPALTPAETCRHAADGRILWETGRAFPALLAAITAPSDEKGGGKMVAVHRTFLERQADGRVIKAPLADAKMTLGRYAGGCIRLWRGASGRAWADAQAGEELLIGEGIEDVATAVMVAPEFRACAAVSLANMGSLVLPPAIGAVRILKQNDPAMRADGAPHPAAIALGRAIAHFHGQGKRVLLCTPPAAVKDINELLQKGA